MFKRIDADAATFWRNSAARYLALATAAVVITWASPGHVVMAQSLDPDTEAEHEPSDPDTGKSTLSKDSLKLLPNPLEERGIKFSATYVGETLGNATGGLRQGAIAAGRLNLAADVNFAKLAGWDGLRFHADVFQIHGRGLSRDFIGNIMTVSGIEALPTTRLYEMWFEQSWFGNKLSLRAGQLGADTEFFISKYTNVFINATYSWATINALNLPGGGPATPLSALGARLKAELSDRVSVLAAVFNGDPAGARDDDDPQRRNRYGLNFRINDPPLAFVEGQFVHRLSIGGQTLPGVIKFGAWQHFGEFDEKRRSASNTPPSGTVTTDMPAQHRGNHAIYAVVEQQLVDWPGGDERDGIGVFARAAASPSDRNLVEAYFDCGVNIAGAFASRPNDKMGISFAHTRISSAVRAADRDDQILRDALQPVRSAESVLSLGYIAEIQKGWLVLPTMQYVIRPGGGSVETPVGRRAAHNATVLGARTVVRF